MNSAEASFLGSCAGASSVHKSRRFWCVSKCHITAILPGRELGVSARRAVLTTNIKRRVTNPTVSVISQQQTVRYKVGNPWNYASFAPKTQDKLGVHSSHVISMHSSDHTLICITLSAFVTGDFQEACQIHESPFCWSTHAHYTRQKRVSIWIIMFSRPAQGER